MIKRELTILSFYFLNIVHVGHHLGLLALPDEASFVNTFAFTSIKFRSAFFCEHHWLWVGMFEK